MATQVRPLVIDFDDYDEWIDGSDLTEEQKAIARKHREFSVQMRRQDDLEEQVRKRERERFAKRRKSAD